MVFQSEEPVGVDPPPPPPPPQAGKNRNTIERSNNITTVRFKEITSLDEKLLYSPDVFWTDLQESYKTGSQVVQSPPETISG